MIGSKAPLIIGIVCGILAIFLVNNHISNMQKQLTEGWIWYR